MANVRLQNPRPEDLNFLRKYFAMNGGGSDSTMSGSFDDPPQANMLAQLMRPPQQTPQFPDAVAGDGFQGLQSGQGIIQQTNEDGSMNAPIRINSQPQQGAPQVARDWSQAQVDIPGVGRGYYGKDGQVYKPDGSRYLTPETQRQNAAQSMAEQDRQLKIDEMRARTEHTQSQTRTEREKLRQAGLPAAPEKAHYDADRGGYVQMGADGQPKFTPIPGVGEKPIKPTEGYLKQQTGVTNVIGALDSYKAALSGFDAGDIASPDARANIETLYNNAMLQAKEAYNLGVLNGPDFEILTKTLTPATSPRGIITSKEALLKQVDTLQGLMERVGQGSAQAHGQPVKPSTRQAQAAPKYSDAEIQHTARKYGISPAEVKRQLGI